MNDSKPKGIKFTLDELKALTVVKLKSIALDAGIHIKSGTCKKVIIETLHLAGIQKMDKKQIEEKISSSTVSFKEDSSSKPGKVFIASMNLRGKWAVAPPGATKLNVTSAQGKQNKNRRDFSPMTPVEGGYEGFWNFEAFWQSGKVFEDIDEIKVKNFWRKVKKATRRYPGSKGKKVLYSRFEKFPEEKMDYVTSRKKIYVPYYFDMMKEKEMTLHWKKYVKEGNDIVIYDFDGPREKNGDLTCMEVTTELLRERINNTRFPFGHGYVVAAWLKDIHPEEYC